jgi:hypothetical protein
MTMTKRKPIPRKKTGGAPKRKSGAAPIQLPPGYEKILDEFGRLEARRCELEKIETRRNNLRKQILEWCEALLPGMGADLHGAAFSITVSPKRPERVIRSIQKAFVALGQAKFLQFCTLPVKALEKNLPAKTYDQLVEEQLIGRRTVTATLRTGGKNAA